MVRNMKHGANGTPYLSKPRLIPGLRDVYIRALRSLQDKDESDPLSYFQVAGLCSSCAATYGFYLRVKTDLRNIGIHGLPYIEWENGGPLRADGWRGYCPHGVSNRNPRTRG